MPVAQKNTSSEAMISSRVVPVRGVDAGLSYRLRLGVQLRVEPRQKLATKRPDGACRHNAFGRAASSHQSVDAGAGDGRDQSAGNVAGGIKRDAGTGPDDVVDQLAVARLLQHEDGELGHCPCRSTSARILSFRPVVQCGSILPRAAAGATNFSM